MRRFFLPSSHLTLFRPAPFAIYCLLLAVLVAGVAWVRTPHRHHPQDQQAVTEYLQRIHQIPARPRVIGYSRERFGDGWGMQVTNLGICTTRHLLLVQTFGGSSGGCASNNAGGASGELGVVDPYTHQDMDRQNVDIDHIVPLAAAWDLGAYAWPEAQRQEFANDTLRNLVVTDSAVNREKSDATLSEWLPPVDQCAYSARFVRVIGDYGLALAEADARAARESCDI